MITPLDNYVVLEEENYKSEGAIVLGDNPNIERQIIAKVILTGPDVKKVKVDDRVMFHYHLFNQTMIEKKMYLIGKEEGIYALA